MLIWGGTKPEKAGKRADIRAVPGGGLAYGYLPASMTRDVVQQIKTNSRDRSLLVIGVEIRVSDRRVGLRKKPTHHVPPQGAGAMLVLSIHPYKQTIRSPLSLA
jgi:hypothetical protein